MPDYDIKATVKKLRECGYDGVEWRVSNSIKSEPEVIPPRDRWYWQYNKSTVDEDTILDHAEEIRDICSAEGIEISALATYIQPHETERIEKVLKAAAIMKCPRIRVNLPAYNGTVNYRELLSKVRKDIEILQELAKSYEVKVNFEMHFGTIAASASAAYNLVCGFDSNYIGVIYDVGNIIHEGFEQHKMGLEVLGEYLDHVHIKNAGWNVREKENGAGAVWQANWVPLEKGQVDFEVFITALKAVGYNGYLSFEDFSNEETTDNKLKGNLEFIKKLL